MNLNDFAVAVAIALVGILLGIAVVGLIRRSRQRSKLLDRGLPGAAPIAIVGAVIIGALFIGLLFVGFVVFLGPFGFAWCAILAFVLIEGFRKHRASQQNALLWLLAAAAERFMPLGPAVEAFASEQGGSFGRRARRLAELLAAGAPLPDALDLCPKLLPLYAMPMVRVGYQSGALAPALHQAAMAHNQDVPIWMSLIGKLTYLLMLPIFGMLVLTFVMFWIIPKFQAIFRDFGSSLPPMTQWLIYISYFIFNYWYIFAPFFLLFAWVIGYALLRYFGWIQWDLPALERFVRRLDTANVLDGLAIVARQQRPMVEGIAELARAYPKPSIRGLLARAAFDIEAGRDWAESLYQRSLIRRADLAVLQAAQRVGNLAWAMQEMADSSRRRFFYRLQATVQAIFPFAVICFGLMVMFIVVSLFLPLVNLIQKMAV